MEDNKNTQLGGTPTPNNNEANGGKNFSQEDMNALAIKVRNEEKSKNEQAVKTAVENAIAEYERKAKLTEEEREKEMKIKREKELKDREDSITLRERRIEAKEALGEKNIPTELVDFVVDLDESKTKDNIELLSKIYNKSVETGVTNKLKGNPPLDFSQENETDNKKKIMSAF